MKVKSESEVTQSCPTFHDPMDYTYQAPRPWYFPGKSIGVGLRCLLPKHASLEEKNKKECVFACIIGYSSLNNAQSLPISSYLSHGFLPTLTV